MVVLVLLLIYRIFYCGEGGSENFVHTNHLSENAPPLQHICARAIWLTEVGGYMKGRKKSENEKNYDNA